MNQLKMEGNTLKFEMIIYLRGVICNVWESVLWPTTWHTNTGSGGKSFRMEDVSYADIIACFNSKENI